MCFKILKNEDYKFKMIKSTNKPLAIVTGASTGLGKKISIDLAEKQFHVVMISRNEKNSKKLKKKFYRKILFVL